MPTAEYYWRHREKCIADVAQWKKDNPERKRENDKLSARRVRATADGLERSLKAGRKYREENKDAANGRTKEWRAKNKGYHSRWHAKNKKKNPTLYMWRNARNR